MNVKPNLDRIVIGYCRVSSNKHDLERQIENSILLHRENHLEIISDIGSGIDYKKKGLKELYEMSKKPNLIEITGYCRVSSN